MCSGAKISVKVENKEGSLSRQNLPSIQAVLKSE